MNTHTLRVVALTLAAAVILLLLVALGTIYTGAYNVAASEPHLGLVRSALNTLQQRSVGARAGAVGDPPPPDSAAMQEAWSHYPEMCSVCHGAPGAERGEIGKGMNPTPPRLERVAGRWTNQEIFWILKHGIKLAGMPAFGETHSDRDLWALTALVRQLPELSPEEYQRLSGSGEQAAGAGEAAGHGEPGHSH
jgi:mono/diheme cytochrome c family protein